MKNFTAMALFVEVVLSGSFTGAAKELGMPLSTLSRKISDLESDLKVKLIDRSRRTLKMTDAGGLYFEHCRRGVDAFTIANRALEERQSEAGGLLRITVPPNMTEQVFLPAIDTFRLRHPKARVQVMISERMLDPGTDPVDLSFRVGPVSDPDLVVRKLATYRHVLTASPMYLADHPTPASPADLSDHTLLGFGFQGATEIRWSFSKDGDQEHVAFTPAVAINDYAALQQAVTLGFGICELPPILCRGALRRRTIVPLLTNWDLPSIDLVAVHSGNRTISRLTRLFLDTCIELIGRQGTDFSI